MANIVIGTVGVFHGLKQYPLGSVLVDRLQSHPWPDGVVIKEMNWPALMVVNDFQSSKDNIQRVVLIAGVNRGLPSGRITCRRWLGGSLGVNEMQERIVQGTIAGVNLDNLLIIGEHFGIWPGEVILIEVQITNNLYGAMAIALSRRSKKQVTSEIIEDKEPDAEVLTLIDELFALTNIAVNEGVDGMPELLPLTAEQLAPLPAWFENVEEGNNGHEILHKS